MPVRIIIADDHAIVRDGLRMVLESHGDMAVIGEAGSGRDAVSQAETLKPDVMLMDISMPELNGIEATRMISERSPAVRIIIFSMYHSDEYVYRGIQAGACAYILKESIGAEVVTAVQTIMRGKRYFGEGVEIPSNKLYTDSHSSIKSPIERLSTREIEVVQLVVEGKTSAEIAGILVLSPKSVETYRSRIMQKINVNNIPSLVKFALQHGITSTENI